MLVMANDLSIFLWNSDAAVIPLVAYLRWCFALSIMRCGQARNGFIPEHFLSVAIVGGIVITPGLTTWHKLVYRRPQRG